VGYEAILGVRFHVVHREFGGREMPFS